MGSFIPGAVIRFSIDEASMVAQVQTALANINAQVAASNKQTASGISSQIANPLIAQAAQLRALYSTGSLGLKDLQVQQRALIASLDTQIKQLATRNDLDNKSLATLKQLTLERERQANALSRNTGVGVTAGTQSALSSVSGPIIANISRLGTGLLGLAGGSGAETTAFSAAAAGIASIAADGGAATAVVAGLSIALLAAGGAAAALAISGGALVQNLSNISQRTGISIQNLQVLGAVASVSNLGLDDIVVGFRKFSQALSGGDGLDTGDGSGGVAGATKLASRILKDLGVTSKDSFTAIEQVADAFEKLPDGPEKAATAVALFGRSGLQLIPILNQGKDGVEKFRDITTQFGPTVENSAVQSVQNWKLANERLSQSLQSLKVDFVPLLDILTKFENGAANFLTNGMSIADPLQVNMKALVEGSTSAATFGTAMDNAFKIGEDGAKRFSPVLKTVRADLDGTNVALQKLIAEGTKELQELNDQANKKAQDQIDSFIKAGQLAVPGATPADDVLVKQRLGMENLAETMLNFPSKAGGVATAVTDLTNTTITDLQKLADEALKKVFDNESAEFDEDVKSQQAIAAILKGVYDQLAVDQASASQNAVAKIIAGNQKMYDELAKQLAERGAGDQAYADLRVAIDADANAKIAKARQDELDKTNKEVEQQAGQLFDALIRGGGSFTKALKDSLENLFLSPVKQVFEAVVGGIFSGPVQAGKDALTGFGRNLQSQHPTGILNQIGKNLAPPTAIGANTTAVSANTAALTNLTATLSSVGGLGGAGGALNPLTGALPLGNVGAEIANLGGGVENLPLPLGNVTAELKNLTGVLTGSTSSGSSSTNSLGSILQNLTSVLTGGSKGTVSGSGIGLFGIGGPGGTPPFLGSSSGGGGALGSVSQVAGSGLNLLLGLGNLIGGIGGHNAGQAIGGGISVVGGALSKISTALGKSGVISAGTSDALQGVGGVIGGAGLVISGVSQGGLGGAVSAAAGGAEIGTAIAPGIGTAIGAVAGFAAGLIGGLFGKKAVTQAQINAALKNQYIDPNTFIGQELDRSAQPTFGQTLASGFSSGPGGIFGNATPTRPQLPVLYNGQGQPIPQPMIVQISTMDSKGVAQFVAQYGGVFAKAVAAKVNTTQTGLSRGIKNIANPA